MSAADLVHELVTRYAKADQVDPEHDVAGQGDGVLPQVVVRQGKPGPVMCAVDLDDQADAGPAHIEVDPALRPATHNLTVGFRQPPLTTQRREVEFALPGRFDISPAQQGEISTVPGVLEVVEV